MMERTSAGDPRRTLPLLWRHHAPPAAVRHGPAPGLTVDRIVQTAISLADEHGLPSLNMRGLAQRLGVAPMTLYTYVPGKAVLLDLMLDAVYAELPLQDTGGQPWRARLTTVAAENDALYKGHAWAAAISTSRPPLGPGLMAKYDHELAALECLGLSDVEMDACLTHLLSFVQSCARARIDARATESETSMTDEQWWAVNAPILGRLTDAKRYPLAARVGTAAGAEQRGAYNPEQAYEFGLALLLDGIGGLIARKRRRSS